MLVTLDEAKFVVLRLNFGYKRSSKVADFSSSWSFKSRGLEVESSIYDRGFLILRGIRSILESLVSKGVGSSFEASPKKETRALSETLIGRLRYLQCLFQEKSCIIRID